MSNPRERAREIIVREMLVKDGPLDEPAQFGVVEELDMRTTIGEKLDHDGIAWKDLEIAITTTPPLVIVEVVIDGLLIVETFKIASRTAVIGG